MCTRSNLDVLEFDESGNNIADRDEKIYLIKKLYLLVARNTVLRSVVLTTYAAGSGESKIVAKVEVERSPS